MLVGNSLKIHFSIGSQISTTLKLVPLWKLSLNIFLRFYRIFFWIIYFFAHSVWLWWWCCRLTQQLLMLRGGFFVLLSREKISSNHDTSVLIVFIFSHNMALFLLSFFFSFRPFFSAVIVGRQCGHKFEGTYPKRGHTCKFWCHSSLPFCLIFCVLFEKKNHVDGLIFNINIGTHQLFIRVTLNIKNQDFL